MTEAEKIIAEKLEDLIDRVHDDPENTLVHSLSSWIDKLKEDHVEASVVILTTNADLERQLAAKDEAIIALQGEKSELLVQLERLQAQHDKAVAENKGLHTVVDQHNGIRVELERRVKQAEEKETTAWNENYALRKRNGKLAKKLEMKRI